MASTLTQDFANLYQIFDGSMQIQSQDGFKTISGTIDILAPEQYSIQIHDIQHKCQARSLVKEFYSLRPKISTHSSLDRF